MSDEKIDQYIQGLCVTFLEEKMLALQHFFSRF